MPRHHVQERYLYTPIFHCTKDGHSNFQGLLHGITFTHKLRCQGPGQPHQHNTHWVSTDDVKLGGKHKLNL